MNALANYTKYENPPFKVMTPINKLRFLVFRKGTLQCFLFNDKQGCGGWGVFYLKRQCLCIHATLVPSWDKIQYKFKGENHLPNC